MITPAIDTTATVNSVTQPKEESAQVPSISVYKYLSSENIQVDQEILITIEINNTGSSSIYSVSVEETDFPNWAFETENQLDFYFVEIPARTQRVLTYKLIPKVVENVTLPSTVVNYYDKPEVVETRKQFTAYSNEIVLDIKSQDLILNYNERFLYLFTLVCAVVIIFVGINTLQLRRKKRSN